jgi:hypothetical protein
MSVNGRRPRDERKAAFCPVECGRCGAGVLAAKFSPQHTVVQWSADAVRACLEFSAAVSSGRPSALVEGCGSLRDSIDAAVLAGRLEVSPPSEVSLPSGVTPPSEVTAPFGVAPP